MDWLFLVIVLPLIIGVIGGIVGAVADSKQKQKAEEETLSFMHREGYAVTKKIGNLLLDEDQQKWTVVGSRYIYDYADIIDFSETVNNSSSKISGGVGVGTNIGLLNIGLSSSRSVDATISYWSIDITVRKASEPLVKLVLYKGSPIKTDSFLYTSSSQMKSNYISQLRFMQDRVMRQQKPQETATAEPVKPEKTVSRSAGRKSTGIDITTKVAGTAKQNDKNVSIQDILSTLNAESDFLLVREPDNPYDPNAVKVVADYQHIGYLKSSVAQEIAPLIDNGQTINIEFLEISGGEGRNYSCNIRLFT